MIFRIIKKLKKVFARIENPQRIKKFLENTSDLDYSEPKDSIDKLSNEVGELIFKEIKYYYKRRKRSKLFSNVTRTLAWTFGTIGFILPISANALSNIGFDLNNWGYLALTLSASFIAANQLFITTISHHRYTTTQIELEKILTQYKIDCEKLNAEISGTPTEEQIATAFKNMQELIEKSYSLINDETSKWADESKEAFNQYKEEFASAKTS